MSALALLGGEKAKSKPFPIWPHYDEAEERALKQVLESRIWWRTPGTKTLAFEQAFAKFHGARHGIAVTNGTAALELAMAALGLHPGDEVIVPDFTFVVAFARFGIILILALYLQAAQGWSALRTGLIITPTAIGMMVAAPIAARLARRGSPGRPVPAAPCRS